MPKLTIVASPIQQVFGDILIVPVDSRLEITQFFSEENTRKISDLMKKVQFQGEWARAELFVAPSGLSVPFVALVGMGSTDIPDEKRAEGIRRAVASVIVDGKSHMLRNIHIMVPSLSLLAPCIESILLADYVFSEHSTLLQEQQKARCLTAVTFHVENAKDIPDGKAILRDTEQLLAAVTRTRDLVNQPASHMSPTVLVEEAKKIAKMSPRISLTVLDKKQAEKKHFSAFLAVARGSDANPYVIHLKYVPKKKATKRIVFVGKGITFDSGGLSLKPAQSMENMKIDMGGAATVLGLFSLLPTLLPDIEIHGVIPTCENMPSGNAFRPGDVIPTMSGKTIEVLNTDAEGRVILADGITYALQLKPDAVITVATLTGSIVAALGDTHAGLFGNTESLNTAILHAAKEAGEGLVELPLPVEYRPTIQSRVADVRNIATMKVGGAITAALFLQEFVGPSTGSGQAVAWAHLDIAGPVYAEQPLLPYWQFGATRYGVRTFAKYIERLDGRL